jgi:hypothetical protein
MKDYTVSHPCGLEETCSTLKGARLLARNHKTMCRFDDPDSDCVAIDEYDSEGGDFGNGELTGKYWKV